MLLLANEWLPSISIGCLWVGPDSCGASETLGGEISREAASERRGPLPVMFCLVLTCTKHLNSHWFGEGNIWEGPHQSKGSTGRSCQEPRGANAVQRSRGGEERKSVLSLCLSPSSPRNCNDPFYFLIQHIWDQKGFGEPMWSFWTITDSTTLARRREMASGSHRANAQFLNVDI